jgi:cell filamentation protein
VDDRQLPSLFPDLFGGLPLRTVRRVQAVVGSARQEGYRPLRWELALLVAVDRGELDHDEALAAVRAEFPPATAQGPTEFPDWPSYLYRGTRVLVNLLGLQDSAVLHVAEARLTCLRAHQLLTRPATVDLSGPPSTVLPHIHRELFQDVYGWAGRFRTVNIDRGGHFASVRSMVETADLPTDIAHRPDLAQRRPAGLARDLARIYQAINHAHLFRDGNGRSSKTYLALLADRVGFDLNYDAVPAGDWIRASQNGRPVDEFWPDPADLESLFRERILQSRSGR